MSATALGVSLPGAAQAKPRAFAGPHLLTISGGIGKSNRGPVDQALDQLMIKHGAKFDRAFEFDSVSIAELPSVTIEPTLEYDSRPHALSGPLLSSVLEVAGVSRTTSVSLALRALDGYTIVLSSADVRRYRMILANSVDSRPMTIGGLGPLWAVFDAGQVAPFKDQAIKDRFALCPWGLYAIDVRSS